LPGFFVGESGRLRDRSNDVLFGHASGPPGICSTQPFGDAQETRKTPEA
jgi:hypothetical protein